MSLSHVAQDRRLRSPTSWLTLLWSNNVGVPSAEMNTAVPPRTTSASG
jgi:hypothetical protein